MTARARTRLPLWAAGLAALLSVAWTFLVGSPHLAGTRSLLDRLEAPLADLRLVLAGPRPAPSQVVIVAIDDRTVASEGGYPLSRARIAEIVRRLSAVGAKVVAIDLLFLEPSEEEADRRLVEAVSEVPTVLAAAARFSRPHMQANGPPQSTQELWPLPSLRAAASVGLVNVSADAGGTPRHLPMVFVTSQGPAPAFSLRAAALFLGAEPVIGKAALTLGGQSVRLDLGEHLPLRFYGPAGSVETLSAADILAEDGFKARLAGRLAVLGVTATAVGDTFSTPFDPVTPGVEVLATGIGNLLAGDALIRDAAIRRIDLVISAGLAAASAVALAIMPPSLGIPLVLLITGAWLGALAFFFAEGWWLSAALPIAAVIPSATLVTLARQIHERRQAGALARAQDALARLQPPALAAEIAQNPSFLRHPVERSVAILFLDLSGFSRLSEFIGPAKTGDFLKEFHALIENEVVAHEGMVLGFMGDGAMIVFGVLGERADDASRAQAAALALVTGVRGWIGQTEGAGGAVDVRVGAHFGPVVLSRLGSQTHEHITAAGDSVNLASRLMEVAKEAGAQVAVSAELLAAMGPQGAEARQPDEMRDVDIRGRSRKARVGLYRWERR